MPAMFKFIWCVRYVENRLVVLDAFLKKPWEFQCFLADELYEKPVELETVYTPDATQEFLDFDFQSYKPILLLREVP